MVDIYILMGLKRKLNRICIQLSRIFGVLMIVMTMRSGKIILKTIQLFSLTSEQKYHYTQMKLVGQTYWWWKDIHIDYQCRFVLENHLCTFYASHFLYAPEVACKKPNVEQELELEKSQLRDLVAKCKEILASARKLLASYVVKVDPDSEPLVLVEPDIFDEAEPKVVEDSKPESEVKEPLIYTIVDLPVEPTMKLVSSLTARVLLRPLTSTNLCRSIYRRQNYMRSTYSWCKV